MPQRGAPHRSPHVRGKDTPVRTTSLRNRSELIAEDFAVTMACPSSYKPKGEALSELIPNHRIKPICMFENKRSQGSCKTPEARVCLVFRQPRGFL